MKREILCVDCAEGSQQLLSRPKLEIEDGQMFSVARFSEHVKFIYGKLIWSCVCDHCNIALVKDERACAMSIWADHTGGPYYKWEHEYIEEE